MFPKIEAKKAEQCCKILILHWWNWPKHQFRHAKLPSARWRFLDSVNFITQDLKFYKIYHLFWLSFSHDRKIWGNERISFSRNPGLHSHWIFKFTTLLFSLELCKLIHFRPLTVFYCVQLLQESWLERIARFRFYIHIFENHTMIYIEAEKKRSIRSVARGISVGRNLVSKYLYLHLIFSRKVNSKFSWMFTRSK